MQDIIQNRIEMVTLQNGNVTVIVAMLSKKPYQPTLYIFITIYHGEITLFLTCL